MLSKHALQMVVLPLMYAMTADAVMARAFALDFFDPPQDRVTHELRDQTAQISDGAPVMPDENLGHIDADIFAMTVIPPDFGPEEDQRPRDPVGFDTLFRSSPLVSLSGSAPFIIPRSNAGFGPARYTQPASFRGSSRRSSIAAVPVPAALPLLATALAGLGLARAGVRRKRRRKP